jgi:hypothetical protein
MLFVKDLRRVDSFDMRGQTSDTQRKKSGNVVVAPVAIGVRVSLPQINSTSKH